MKTPAWAELNSVAQLLTAWLQSSAMGLGQSSIAPSQPWNQAGSTQLRMFPQPKVLYGSSHISSALRRFLQVPLAV